MPIEQMTYKQLWGLKKADLVTHVEELYQFIEIFSGFSGGDLAVQIKDLKQKNL